MSLFLLLALTLRPSVEHHFYVESTDFARVRSDLLAVSGGFTEVGTGSRRLYMAGTHNRAETSRLKRLLREWKTVEERRGAARDRNEIFFVLPHFKNGGGNRPIFSAAKMASLHADLASTFHYTPEYVEVYGEWKDKDTLHADSSMLIRVPARRGTRDALRRFLREKILADPENDQICLYMSAGWRGELIYP